MLGFESQDLVGKSILKIVGKATDSARFSDVIFGTGKRQSSISQFVLYDRNGEQRTVLVTCEPVVESDGLIFCQMTFEHSDAVTLQEAFEDTLCPKLLISSEPPHSVKIVNDSFLAKFGCSRADILGRSFDRFQSCDTTGWTALFAAANRGKVSRNIVRASTHASTPDDVISVPVVEGANGGIEYILVLFAPAVADQAYPSSIRRQELREQSPSILPHPAGSFGPKPGQWSGTRSAWPHAVCSLDHGREAPTAAARWTEAALAPCPGPMPRLSPSGCRHSDGAPEPGGKRVCRRPADLCASPRVAYPGPDAGSSLEAWAASDSPAAARPNGGTARPNVAHSGGPGPGEPDSEWLECESLVVQWTPPLSPHSPPPPPPPPLPPPPPPPLVPLLPPVLPL